MQPERRHYPHAVTHRPGLTPTQAGVVAGWFPGAELVEDLSWGQTDTAVLHLRHDGHDVVVKAGGPSNHHIGREITGHECFTAPLLQVGGAARLLHADRDLRLLATEYLPGTLVEGDPAEWVADTYRQAGALLAALHSQASRSEPDYEATADARALAWFDEPHRIAPETVARLREALAGGGRVPATVVPTHGDWQPRNWLVHEGAVRVIDLGRADWRPAYTDFARLAAQQFRGRPHLERAFVEGYGHDPREPEAWRRTRIREAIGTAVWAYRVGDEGFEAQGHRMIAEALAT